MTKTDYINLLAACTAAASALLWALSARVNIRKGFDMDKETADDLKKSAKLNGAAAAFAAVSAICATAITAAKFVPWLSWISS